MALAEMLAKEGTTIGDVSALLGELDAEAQRQQVSTLNRKQQRRLYELAGEAEPVTIEHFVPTSVDDLIAVHHHGRNTLPLPGKHKFFQKRFCRPPESGERLFGYNEAPSRGLLGPGYFVAQSTHGQPEWAKRGGVVVNYFEVPDGPVADGWPVVVPNHKGLQRFVYNRTRDFMRRVSGAVSIGAAYKEEKQLDHYFVLVRGA